MKKVSLLLIVVIVAIIFTLKANQDFKNPNTKKNQYQITNQQTNFKEIQRFQLFKLDGIKVK